MPRKFQKIDGSLSFFVPMWNDGDMKMMKFRKYLSEMILRGEKTTTWRLFDDKNLTKGDRVTFMVKETLEPFATAVLTDVRETTLGELTEEDWMGHERFETEQEMYDTYMQYYDRPVDAGTAVKIIRFKIGSIHQDLSISLKSQRLYKPKNPLAG